MSRLVEDAIEDKVASDATSRNALTKLQSALAKIISSKDEKSRSQEPSPRPSSVPATATDGDEGADQESMDTSVVAATEAMDGMRIQSAAPTPVASPRKRSSRQTPAPKKKKSQQIHEDEDEDGDVSMAVSVAATPATSPRKSTRSGRTTTAATASEEATNALEQENIPPPSEPTPTPSPQKKSRGRPRKTMPSENESLKEDEDADAANKSPEPQIKIEDDESNNVDVPVVRKTRGKPSINGATTGAPPRKSVRAGRRKVTEESQ